MPQPEQSLLRRLAQADENAITFAPAPEVPREGVFGGYRMTWGGIQVSTIDGQQYATLFDFRDPNMRGLKPGAIVEWIPSGKRQHGWDLEYAKILRVVTPPSSMNPVARLLERFASDTDVEHLVRTVIPIIRDAQPPARPSAGRWNERRATWLVEVGI